MRSKEPDKTIPRATFGFIAVTGATCALSVWVIIQAIRSQDARASTGADPPERCDDDARVRRTTFVDIVTLLLCTSGLCGGSRY